jgi:HEAT repeat protein
LNDSHREVVGAAVRALGAGGGLEGRQPLKRLLGSADESLRVEVATALARLGDPAGPAALERLAYSSDPVVRRQVAAAMGQVPDPAYKATLVRLLDDQYSIRLAAVDSLSKVAPRDESGVENAEQGSVTERVARWKRAVRQ